MSTIEEIREPFVSAQLIIPADCVGVVMQLAMERRGRHNNLEEYWTGFAGGAGGEANRAAFRRWLADTS